MFRLLWFSLSLANSHPGVTFLVRRLFQVANTSVLYPVMAVQSKSVRRLNLFQSTVLKERTLQAIFKHIQLLYLRHQGAKLVTQHISLTISTTTHCELLKTLTLYDDIICSAVNRQTIINTGTNYIIKLRGNYSFCTIKFRLIKYLIHMALYGSMCLGTQCTYVTSC